MHLLARLLEKFIRRRVLMLMVVVALQESLEDGRRHKTSAE